MIDIRDIVKSYGQTKVLHEVSLEIPSGGLTALVGPNGAGKSTLLRIVGRLLDADSGSVTINGLDTAKTPSKQLAQTVSVLQQDGRVGTRLTVVDLVRFGRFPHSQGRLRPEDHKHVEDAIERMDIGPFRDRFLDELSGGQRQRAHIAMVLAQDTDYVLLDEPLNSLDIRHSRAMMHAMRTMVTELGKTVVVVLHDVNFAAAHADQIVALKEGKVVAALPPNDFMQRDVLQSIYDVEVDVVDTPKHKVAAYFA